MGEVIQKNLGSKILTLLVLYYVKTITTRY